MSSRFAGLNFREMMEAYRLNYKNDMDLLGLVTEQTASQQARRARFHAFSEPDALGLTIDITLPNVVDIPQQLVNSLWGPRILRLLTSTNQLTKIPNNLAFLTCLRVIDLANNNFEIIPDAGLKTPFPEALYMAFNKVRTIPSRITMLND
jgi:Leucine-rich repeat (LRR) protein